MREADFSKIIVNSFNQFPDRFFASKIPDSVKALGLRFIPKKPFDIFVLGSERSFAIECKQTKNNGAFHIGLMEASQLKALRQCEQAGVPAFVFFHVHMKLDDHFWAFRWAEISRPLKQGLRISSKSRQSIGERYDIRSGSFDVEEFCKDQLVD